MDTDAVEKDLNTRIEQSRAWLLGSPAAIANIKFRKGTWTATPIAFLDHPGRKERHGVAFRFSLDDLSRNISVLLRIRIKPEATIGENDDSWPYVIIYIVNQASGADVAIAWHYVKVPASYKDMVGLSIEVWYQKWIAHALASKGHQKILDRKMALHD